MKQGKRNILAAAVSSALLLSGCGDVASVVEEIQKAPENETPSDNNTPDNNNPPINNSSDQPYSGSSIIKGLISLSSLTRSDSYSYENATAKGIMSRALTRASDDPANTPDNAIVKLYVVGPDGELIDTNIDCAFTGEDDEKGNPGYKCDGAADGLHYVVKFIKLIDGDKAIEMKVNVEVPQGQVNVDSPEISPQSTVVADTIVNAILSATAGQDIDQDVIDNIIGSVKTAIIKLVESGAVQIPSMVTEAPKDEKGDYIDNVADFEGEQEIQFAENEQMDSAAGALLSSQAVANGLDIVKVDIDLKRLESIETDSDEGKHQLIKRIFNELLGDSDMPRFFFDFLSTQYIAGETTDLQSLFGAIAVGLRINPQFGVDMSELDLTKSDAMAAFEKRLSEIYSLLDRKTNGELTEADKESLAQIQAVIPAAFSRDDWQNRTLEPTDELNIPQAIVFTIFITDDYIRSSFKEYASESGQELKAIASAEKDENGVISVEMDEPVDFDPMHYDENYDPDSNLGQPGFMQLLGFFDKENIDNLTGIDIFQMDIMPGKAWIPEENGMGQEHDMLRVEVGISDVAAMAAMIQPSEPGEMPSQPELSVTLEYPTSTGTASVELMDEAELFYDRGMPPSATPLEMESAEAKGEHPPEMEGDSRGGNGPSLERRFILDPWRMKQKDSESSMVPTELTLDDIISDFTSGIYTIVVKDADGNELERREFKKKVLIGMQYASPRLTSPNGMPQWPVECQFTMGECTEFDKQMQEWTASGGTTTFAPEDGAEEAKITLSWERPKVELPDGVKIAYSLNIGFNKGCNEYGCDWELIYDSWQSGRLLFGTSFTLPTPLAQTDLASGADYNVNVCAQFIDTETGDEIGQGGCGHANFFVGEPLDLSATFDIKGQVPTGLDGPWKVALISEKMNEDSLFGGWETTVHQISDIDDNDQYLLQPTLGDFLNGEMMPPQIVLFKDDADKEGEIEEREMRFWPNGTENIRFDAWGGILRYVKESRPAPGSKEPDDFKRKEIVVTGGESLIGPSFLYLKDDPFFTGQGLTGEDTFGDKIIDIPLEGYPDPDKDYPKPGTEGNHPDDGTYPELGTEGNYPDNGTYPEPGVEGKYPDDGTYPEPGTEGKYPDDGMYPEPGTEGNYPDDGTYPEPGVEENYPDDGTYPELGTEEPMPLEESLESSVEVPNTSDQSR